MKNQGETAAMYASSELDSSREESPSESAANPSRCCWSVSVEPINRLSADSALVVAETTVAAIREALAALPLVEELAFAKIASATDVVKSTGHPEFHYKRASK